MRRCLGASFAQFEMKRVLAGVASKARPRGRRGTGRARGAPSDHAHPQRRRDGGGHHARRRQRAIVTQRQWPEQGFTCCVAPEGGARSSCQSGYRAVGLPVGFQQVTTGERDAHPSRSRFLRPRGPAAGRARERWGQASDDSAPAAGTVLSTSSEFARRRRLAPTPSC